jgi:hypothetical protein
MVMMTGLGRCLYCIRGGTLYRVDPSMFDRWKLSDDWEGAWAIASTGKKLFVLKGDALHEVNPDTVKSDDVIFDDW